MPTALLVVAVLALAVGPAVASLGGRASAWRVGFDGFAVILVAGLCVLHLMPHALEHGGFMAVVAGLIGAVLPIALERLGGRLVPAAELTGLVLLVAHAIVDGAALAVFSDGPGLSVGLAVAVHRLPVGFAVFAFAARARAPRVATQVAWSVIGLIAAGTLVGFLLGGPALASAPEPMLAILEGAVAGFLLHMVIEPQSELPSAALRPWSVAGAMCGVVILMMVSLLGGDEADLEPVARTVEAYLRLAVFCAPALLLGYASVALAHLLPRSLRVWRRFAPVITIEAALVSLPLVGLGVAAARLAGAVGLLGVIHLVAGRPPVLDDDEPEGEGDVAVSLREHLVNAARQGLGTHVDRTMPWILVGLAIAALAEPHFDQAMLALLPAPLHVPVMSLVGLAIPAGAAGVTPIAAMAAQHGITSGGTVALLLASPAAYATTMGPVVARLDALAAARVGLSIVLVALVVGWSVDLIGLPVPALPAAGASGAPGVMGWISVMALGALALGSLVRLGPRGLIARVVSPRLAGMGRG